MRRTGYTDARDVWARLLGDTGPAWARDDEGELAGAYRPRAHRGVRSLTLLLSRI
jgi:hypothetical protein